MDRRNGNSRINLGIDRVNRLWNEQVSFTIDWKMEGGRDLPGVGGAEFHSWGATAEKALPLVPAKPTCAGHKPMRMASVADLNTGAGSHRRDTKEE